MPRKWKGRDMNDVIGTIESALCKSVLEDLKRYIKDNREHNKWMMYSDYCIGDEGKPNDVISFTIMPYDDHHHNIKGRIFSLASTDIKEKRTIAPDFIAYLREKRLFHINFIVEGLTQADGFVEGQLILESLDNASKMIDRWCDNTPDNANYFQDIKRKLTKTKNELSKKSPNYTLFREVALISLLSGYIGYLFTKHGNAQIFGWFSDRDRVVDAYNMLIADLFMINHHGFCERDSINSSQTKIAFGLPKSGQSSKLWYDEMNRLPDHIAGTLADYDIESNSSSKSKFVEMLEGVIADNPYLVVLRLNLEPKNLRCCKVVFSKRPHVERDQSLTSAAS